MRTRRIRDIVIELTSLLDVVMILIFAVMIENSRMVEASEAETIAVKTSMEEMRSDIENHEAIMRQIEEDYELKLEEKDREIVERNEDLKQKEQELLKMDETLATKEQEVAEAKDETEKLRSEGAALEKQLNDTLEELSKTVAEKQEISADLAVAQKKLDQGSVEELLAKLANAESKIKGYEYLEKLIVSYNIGCKSFYENESDEFPIYRFVNYGRAGTDQQDGYEEFRDDNERDAVLERMKERLKEGIDAALEEGANSVYIFFNYNQDMITTGDRKAVENALNDLISKYDARVLYKPIKNAE